MTNKNRKTCEKKNHVTMKIDMMEICEDREDGASIYTDAKLSEMISERIILLREALEDGNLDYESGVFLTLDCDGEVCRFTTINKHVQSVLDDIENLIRVRDCF